MAVPIGLFFATHGVLFNGRPARPEHTHGGELTMKWRGRVQSGNVEDRRGMSPQLAMKGGGGIVVVMIILAMRFLGAPPEAQQIAGQLAQQLQQNQVPAEPNAGANTGGFDDDSREFVAVVLHDTETVWTQLFAKQVRQAAYQAPKLVMFSGEVNSGCGAASADMGPFYCPADRKIYLDPAFFDDLAVRHRAAGDFAQAYVIAHEVSHHVQNLLGYSRVSDEARRSGDKIAANQMSVRLELQADFLAGVWAHYAHREYSILEPGDIQEAITAANRIGDDTLQREATGRVVPERYTHGTSEQRARWFRRGFESGKLQDCEILFRDQYESL